jgi:hypothetical protein
VALGRDAGFPSWPRPQATRVETLPGLAGLAGKLLCKLLGKPHTPHLHSNAKLAQKNARPCTETDGIRAWQATLASARYAGGNLWGGDDPGEEAVRRGDWTVRDFRLTDLHGQVVWALMA